MGVQGRCCGQSIVASDRTEIRMQGSLAQEVPPPPPTPHLHAADSSTACHTLRQQRSHRASYTQDSCLLTGTGRDRRRPAPAPEGSQELGASPRSNSRCDGAL